MKPQDILFFAVIVALLYKRNPRHFVWAGIISLLAAIPLFAKYVFFTAEHLTWYAAGFFLVAIILFIVQNRKEL